MICNRCRVNPSSQAAEEMEHAERFIKYLQERGATVVLGAIEAPRKDWPGVTEVFKEALEHEKLVTSLINKIMDAAVSEKDYATVSALQWFIDEQVEEEDVATGIVDKLVRINGKIAGLMVLDGNLGKRDE